MKKQKTFLLVMFMFSLMSLLWCEYMIGGFVYNKPSWESIYPGLTEQIMQKMESADFNTAVSSAVDNTDPDDFTTLLNTMNNSYSIGGIPEYYTFDPANNRYGARTLSMGNYFRFEAEYHDALSISDEDQIKQDKYFYMSSNADSARVGDYNPSEDNGYSNKHYWQVNNGQQGYAYKDLTYKWTNGNTTQRIRVGGEFRFPQHGTGNDAFFNLNEFFITYSMQCLFDPNLPDTTRLAAISFNCKGTETNSTMYVDIRHFPDPTTQDSCYISYITKASYLNSPVNPNPGLQSQRLVTVTIPVKSLNYYGAIDKGIWYWDEALINLNPNLWWYGHGTLRLDYIEFQDKLFRDYTSNNSILSQIQTFGCPFVYGYDEPGQGQFESFRRINRYWETTTVKPQLVTAVHQYNKQAIKTNGDNYRHRQAFMDAVTPKTIFIDEYPFNNYYSPDWADTSSTVFVQKYIDKVCNQYDSSRVMCGIDKQFVAVPQTYGQWYNGNSKWKYLLPPDKVVKSLQFLPLCYKAAGIADFLTYKATAVDSGNYRNYGIINLEPGHSTLAETPQYVAIKDANRKIKLYGPKIDSLTWQGAGTIMTTAQGVNLGSVLSNVCIDNLYVPPVANPSLYQGYVQAGLYTDSYHNDNPYLMLVNRRANIAPTNLSHISPGTDNLDAYNLAIGQVGSQSVWCFPSNNAYLNIGSYIGFYDHYDSTLMHQNSSNSPIDISIGPGDGKLLQMVSSLPSRVDQNAILKQTGYLKDTIEITDSSHVVFDHNSDITLLPNTTINIRSGSSLTIYNKCAILENCHINIDAGGVLNFSVGDTLKTCSISTSSDIVIQGGTANITGTKLVFTDNAKLSNFGGELNIAASSLAFSNGYLEIEGLDPETPQGSLHISQSELYKNNDVDLWKGMQVQNADLVSIDNSNIKNALVGLDAHDTNVNICNVTFEIPTYTYGTTYLRSLGMKINNGNPDCVTQIVADDSTSGFYGSGGEPTPLDQKTGAEIYCSRTYISGLTFQNLYQGLNLTGALAQEDSITWCLFNNCNTGIYNFANYISGKISHCRFTQTNSNNYMIGISTHASAPAVRNCEFYNLRGCGILTWQSSYVNQAGFEHNTFYNCGTVVDPNTPEIGGGIVSYYCNSRITHNLFYHNSAAILNHAESNLDLSHDACNDFQENITNIAFTEAHPYQAWIQISSGHNIFRHCIVAPPNIKNSDFTFDCNYFNSYPLDVIDGDYNWFDNAAVYVNPDSLSYYVKVNNFDPITYSPVVDTTNRFYTALDYEYNSLWTEAYNLYQDIIIHPQGDEKKYMGACADGIYRIALNKTYPTNEVISFFDSQNLQYATTDPYLSKLMESYLLKELVIAKDYQAAIDLIQPRIDNPFSEIDSLRAVLDIELILQLAQMEANKRPVATAYQQYKYPDMQTYAQNHEKHFQMMLALLNHTEAGNEVIIPPISTLFQNFPNPFNPNTTISFAIPKQAGVKIKLYNLKGQLVKTLCSASMGKGFHRIVWDGRDELGNRAGSGMYLIRMETAGKVLTKKAMLLK